MLTPSLGKQASGEGCGGQVPQYSLAFPPAATYLPAKMGACASSPPKKASVGAEGYLQPAGTSVMEPTPSWPNLCLLLLPRLPHPSSRLSSSACTFSPSWAGCQRPPGGLEGRAGLMSGSERTRGKSGSGGARRPHQASSRSCQASEIHLCRNGSCF